MDSTTETAPLATAGARDPQVGSDDTSRIHPLDSPEDQTTRHEGDLAATPTGSGTRTDDSAAPVATTPPDEAPVSGRKTRSVGSNRHLTSIVLAVVAVPVGYGFLDYAFYRVGALTGAGADTQRVPDRLLVMFGAAAACFLLAALAGRISALGPLVAGLLWGAAPAAWTLLDYRSYVDRLNDLPEFWHNTGFGLASAGFVVFPAVAGLLIGIAVAGKWRRPLPVSRW